MYLLFFKKTCKYIHIHITETSFPTTEINKHCNFVINLRQLHVHIYIYIYIYIYISVSYFYSTTVVFLQESPHLQVLEQFRDSRLHVHRLVAQQFSSRVHPQYASCKQAADT